MGSSKKDAAKARKKAMNKERYEKKKAIETKKSTEGMTLDMKLELMSGSENSSGILSESESGRESIEQSSSHMETVESCFSPTPSKIMANLALTTPLAQRRTDTPSVLNLSTTKTLKRGRPKKKTKVAGPGRGHRSRSGSIDIELTDSAVNSPLEKRAFTELSGSQALMPPPPMPVTITAQRITTSTSHQVQGLPLHPYQIFANVPPLRDAMPQPLPIPFPVIRGNDFADHHQKTIQYHSSIAQREIVNLYNRNLLLDDGGLYAYLISLGYRSGKRFVVIHPGFSYYHFIGRVNPFPHERREDQEGEDQQFAYNSCVGHREDYEVVIIPLFVDGSHWTLAIYDIGTAKVFYYDTLRGHRLTERIEFVIRAILSELEQRARLGNDIQLNELRQSQQNFEIITVDQSLYNTQQDGINCGFHAALITETFIFNSGCTWIPRIEIGLLRDQIVSHLIRLTAFDNLEFTPIKAIGNPNFERRQANPNAVSNSVNFGPMINPPIRSRESSISSIYSSDSFCSNFTDISVSGDEGLRRSERIRSRQSSLNSSLISETSMTPSERDQKRRNKAKVYKTLANWRSQETEAEHQIRLISRNKNRRNICPPTEFHCKKDHDWGCASKDANHWPETFNPGKFGDENCPKCNALLLRGELSTNCCKTGKVILNPDDLATEDPHLLQTLKDRVGNKSKAVHFANHAAIYNALVAFASVSAKAQDIEDYRACCILNATISHQIGDLHCGPNQTPKFNQLYIYDPKEAHEIRKDMDIFKSNDIEEKLLFELDAMLREHNPFAKAFLSIHRQYEEDLQLAIDDEREIPRFLMSIVNRGDVPQSAQDSDTIHPNRNNPPNPNEVAVLWRSTDGNMPDNLRGTFLRVQGTERNARTREIPYFDPNRDLLCYPLLYPRGTNAYRLGIKKTLGDGDIEEEVPREDEGLEDQEGILMADRPDGFAIMGPRKFVSRREWQLFRYALRNENNDVKAPHQIWSMDNLGRRYVIDSEVATELNEAQHIKDAQEKSGLRATLHSDFVRGLEKGLKDGATLGSIALLPKTFKGSPRHMQEAYTKFLAICRRVGQPAFLLTMTANPKWPEIQDALMPGQTADKRPDLVCRAFRVRLAELNKLIEKGVLFGKCIGHLQSLEFQKRGFPHVHKLIILDKSVNVESTDFVEQYLSAEIPEQPEESDKSDEAEKKRLLHKLVTSLMLHDCKKANCRKKDNPDVCKMGFPKPFSQVTHFLDNGRTEYIRRSPQEQGGYTHRIGTRLFDNSFVVPYNPLLLIYMQCHINIEKSFGKGGIEYALKYLTKGAEMAYVKVTKKGKKVVEMPLDDEDEDSVCEIVEEDGNERARKVVDFDEFVWWFLARYYSDQEAYMRTCSDQWVRMSHSVQSFSVHAEKAEPILFRGGEEIETFDRLMHGGVKTPFTAFMTFCNKNPKEAKDITFLNAAEHLVYDKKKKAWHLPKIDAKGRLEKVIGRIYPVYGSNPELFAIRILACNVKCPKSFTDLRTFEEIEYETFTEAAQARGLLDSDEIWDRTLAEASEYLKPFQFTKFFALMLLYSMPQDPRTLFEKYKERMMAKANPQRNNDEEIRLQAVLKRLAIFFARSNKTNAHFLLPLAANFDPLNDIDPYFFPEYDNDTEEEVETLGEKMYGQTRPGQREVVDAILNAIELRRANPADVSYHRNFFMGGSGGCGKTHTINTLIHLCIDKLRYILPCASTGIASTVLYNATTAHSTFGLKVKENKAHKKIPYESLQGQKIRRSELIIIDEITMFETKKIDEVDEVCRDMEPVRSAQKSMKFAGKVVLFGGDFKQLLPVMPGKDIPTIAAASFRSSEDYRKFKIFELKENIRLDPGQEQYKAWTDEIGLGTNFISGTDMVELPEDMVVYERNQLIDFVFDNESLSDPNALAQRAILCPTNVIADKINQEILAKVKVNNAITDHRRYNSIDQAIMEDPNFVYAANNHVENLNQFDPPNFPPHILELKVGAVVILLMNLDLPSKLSNGTKMVIDKLGADVIVGRILLPDGSLAEKQSVIPRTKMEFDDSDKKKRGIHFVRIQFPVKLSFAMTINKAQGQTIRQKLGLYLMNHVFMPGMLYVGLTRTTRKENVKILVRKQILGGKPCTRNLVWQWPDFEAQP